MESVASTIFACRLFRGQEGFLRHQKERMADPTLAGIELDGLTAAASSLHGSAKGDEIVEVEAVDVEKGIHLESRKEGRKGSVETTRREASVTFIDICVEHSAKDEAGNLEKGQC
nr:hypothetical protein BN887_04788 [Melanopsichium pennsylvanicum 4]